MAPSKLISLNIPKSADSTDALFRASLRLFCVRLYAK